MGGDAAAEKSYNDLYYVWLFIASRDVENFNLFRWDFFSALEMPVSKRNRALLQNKLIMSVEKQMIV